MSDGPVRILCIEDNAMNWRLVQRLLSQAGHEMHWAEEGLRGCELALALRPDLILLDLNLPGLSGFEVATKLRQEPGLRDCLIIALTAKTLKDDRETALVTGCDGFIPKPIDPFLFVGQVEAYLQGHRDRLEPGREGAALRQFSRQVVDHLEGRLMETRLGALQLQAAQAETAQRSQHLSRILALSRRLAALHAAGPVLAAVLPELRDLVPLEGLQVYRIHPSGAYYLGEAWAEGGPTPRPTLPASHPVAAHLAGLAEGGVLHGEALRAGPAWHPGLDAGLWPAPSQPVLVPFLARSGTPRLGGFLAGWRPGEPFSPRDVELVGICAGLLQVSLENADLHLQVAETSQALGTSYEGLELAQEALAEARRALGAMDLRAATADLVDQFGPLLAELAATPCAHPGTVGRLEGLVEALRRRVRPRDLRPPETLSLHGLLQLEVAVARAEGLPAPDLEVDLDLQAGQDRIFGVRADFEELVSHLLDHARIGHARRVQLRTRGEAGDLVLEAEDDGRAIPPSLQALAFLGLPDEVGTPPGGARWPGPGLAACVQLLAPYRGVLELVPRASGSLLRLRLPLDGAHPGEPPRPPKV